MIDRPRVWNLRDKHRITLPRGAVYCGRGTPYGNPFIAGQHGSRETVIRKFVELVLPELCVDPLRGKHLVCWCAPLPCHCDHILIKANRSPRVPQALRDLHDSWGNADALLEDRTRVRIEKGDWFRADGNVECPCCHEPYWKHSPIVGALWLSQICAGDLVHL